VTRVRCVVAVVSISALVLALASLVFDFNNADAVTPTTRGGVTRFARGDAHLSLRPDRIAPLSTSGVAPLNLRNPLVTDAYNRVLVDPDLWAVFMRGKLAHDAALLSAAAIASEFCAGIGLTDDDVFPDLSEGDGPRKAAVDVLRKRCGHWAQLPYSTSVKLRRDVHLRMEAALFESPAALLARTGDVAAALRQAISILRSGDLLALQRLDIGGLFPNAPLEGVEGPDFWTTVACELGLDCGPDSVLTISMCARQNMCGADFPSAYFDAWRKEVDDQQLYRVRDLVHRVAVAIQTGHLDTIGISAD